MAVYPQSARVDLSPSSSTRRHRIVIVDDDPEMSGRLEGLLLEEFDVVVTTDWSEISRQVFRVGCRLVLMDVNLPVFQGTQIVDIFRACEYPDGRCPKIVHFAAEDEATLARLSEETGADGFVSKTLRGPRLVEAIRELMA